MTCFPLHPKNRKGLSTWSTSVPRNIFFLSSETGHDAGGRGRCVRWIPRLFARSQTWIEQVNLKDQSQKDEEGFTITLWKRPFSIGVVPSSSTQYCRVSVLLFSFSILTSALTQVGSVSFLFLKDFFHLKTRLGTGIFNYDRRSPPGSVGKKHLNE